MFVLSMSEAEDWELIQQIGGQIPHLYKDWYYAVWIYIYNQKLF